MYLWVAKVISLLTLTSLVLIFGLTPLRLISWIHRRHSSEESRARGTFFIGCLNCFSGGVFFATCMIHLLPEVREALDNIMAAANFQSNFHYAELVVCIGFFIVMIVEHTIMSFQHHHSGIGIQDENTNSVTYCEETKPLHRSNQTPVYGTMGRAIESNSKQESAQRMEVGAGEHGGDPPIEDAPMSRTITLNTRCDHVHPSVEIGGASVHIIQPSHHQHHHLDSQQLQGLRSFILLLALSFHTVFEGLALGLQTEESSVWRLFIAISLHKVIMAFTLGLQFAENIASGRKAVLFIVLFSLMPAIGVSVGTTVVELSTCGLSTSIASAALQGLATGTFIYVTFFEILQREVGQDHSLIKVLAVIIGFLCIVLVNFFGGHQH